MNVMRNRAGVDECENRATAVKRTQRGTATCLYGFVNRTSQQMFQRTYRRRRDLRAFGKTTLISFH